ncbi:MAG: FtsQ-type POTRA domain-containing protein [Myxococcota bacterium]
MLRPFLLGAGLALAAIGAVTAASLPSPVSFTPGLLGVTDVVIEGTDRARTIEVRHLADVHRGVPIWSISAQAVESAVERHPWVRSAEVNVVWPNRVEIQVQERHVAGILLDQERWLYVDDQGVVFLKADVLDYPVLTDMGRSLERVHPELGKLARRRAMDILTVLQREEVVSTKAISEVVFAPNVGFVVHTRGATLLFGLDGTERQVRRLDQVLAMGVNLDQRVTIDLAPEQVALVRPTTTRYPTVANHFRRPRRATTVAQVVPERGTRRFPR